jgi:hypothetical protein
MAVEPRALDGKEDFARMQGSGVDGVTRDLRIPGTLESTAYNVANFFQR